MMLGKKVKSSLKRKRGAVMMEYVIVAVLIGAAVLAAVAVFGRSIMAMFDVSGRAVVGDGKSAADALTDSSGGYRSQLQNNMDEATKVNQKFYDLSEEGK